MPLIFIAAAQTQYTLAYALIFAFVMLGFLIVCIPRPRKEVFRSPEEEQEAKKRAENQKAEAKRNKAKAKRNKGKGKRKKSKKKARK